MDEALAAELRKRLLERGSVHWTDTEGKRIFFVHSTNLDVEGQGILIAYEQGGVIFWPYASSPRPLTRFSLASAGFRLDVADAVLAILAHIKPGD